MIKLRYNNAARIEISGNFLGETIPEGTTIDFNRSNEPVRLNCSFNSGIKKYFADNEKMLISEIREAKKLFDSENSRLKK